MHPINLSPSIHSIPFHSTGPSRLETATAGPAAAAAAGDRGTKARAQQQQQREGASPSPLAFYQYILQQGEGPTLRALRAHPYTTVC
jgi:hypothetical protein